MFDTDYRGTAIKLPDFFVMDNPDGTGAQKVARMTIDADSVSFDFEGGLRATERNLRITSSLTLARIDLAGSLRVQPEHFWKAATSSAHPTWAPLATTAHKSAFISPMRRIKVS